MSSALLGPVPPVVLAAEDLVVGSIGIEVRFADSCIAQSAASGLWFDPTSTGDPVPAGGETGLAVTTRALQERTRSALRHLVDPRRFNLVAFFSSQTGEDRVSTLLRFLVRHYVPPFAGRSARADGGAVDVVWLGVPRAHIAAAPMCCRWRVTATGRPVIDGCYEAGDLPEILGQSRRLAAVVVDPASVFGAARVPREIVWSAADHLAARAGLLVFDESNALLRTGELVMYPSYEVEPDLVMIGPPSPRSKVRVNAYLLSSDTGITPGHEHDDARDADAFHQAVVTLASSVSSPQQRASMLATSELLAQGLAALQERGALAAVQGAGWAYLVRPPEWLLTNRYAPDERALALQLGDDLRRHGLWAPIGPDGHILLLPPTVSTAADVSRILDSLSTVLLR